MFRLRICYVELWIVVIPYLWTVFSLLMLSYVVLILFLCNHNNYYIFFYLFIELAAALFISGCVVAFIPCILYGCIVKMLTIMLCLSRLLCTIAVALVLSYICHEILYWCLSQYCISVYDTTTLENHCIHVVVCLRDILYWCLSQLQ